ncbi:MAG: T9SS type A sorting domain-containing protein [Muribaculaceae bacterium]|nr:T9SS type A sorting domain-containing protein [Muribaculaceae bacterium]
MKKTALAALLLAASTASWAQYSHTINADNLGRGVLAVKADNGVFISWRSLPTDDTSLAFDIYRDGVKVNDAPLTKMTNFTDTEGTVDSKYVIKAILNGEEKESANAPKVWESDFMKIHLDRPEGGTSNPGGAKEDREYTYTPDDVSVGDVNGDGEFEFIVKWFPTNAADNSHTRFTGNTIFDCYKLDGTKLWRIDLGHNIRSGNHYTQFMVYDFDGDGKAELICKTAPGTIDGTGKAVLMGDDKESDDYRKSDGTVMSGPEYLTVFNGQTGAEINTIAYNPPRSIRKNDKTSSGWGDNYGNRSERYLAGVAYLDGVKPSAVFVRGYYTASYVWAVDFDGKELKERWLHKSEKAGEGIYGQGTHSLSIADLDGDGFDEIIIGSGALDHDGSFLHSTGGGHGDALHVGDFILENEGLEIFMPHEDKTGKYATTLRDGKTGKILYYQAQPSGGKDVGRGLIANVSSKFSGSEYWSSLDGDVMNSGKVVGSKRPSVNFRIFWDGDLLDELLDGTTITKPNENLTSISNLKAFAATSHAASCNTTKATPNLQADIFGDWREEVILHDSETESDLIIFTTTIPSEYKVPCLMTDRQYREAIAWQNVAYNQPPHLSYNLEAQYDTRPRIIVTQGGLQQVISLGESIDDIEFKVMRAEGAEVSGLPEGVEFSFDSNEGKGIISGIPAEKGEWTYTISTVGSEDGEDISISGTIRVTFVDKSGRAAYFSFDNIGAETVLNDYKGTTAAINGSVGAEEGVSNGAITFDGNGYLTQTIYEELMLGKNDFSIELWMKSTDQDGYLFCIGTHNHDNVEGGTGNWIGLERLKNESTDRLCFSIDDDVTKSDCYALSPSQYFDGEWHQIVCVRNAAANSMTIFIDGKQNISTVNTGTGALSFNPTELMWIGGDDELTSGREHRTFNGSIDELTIYPFVLSKEEVLANYEKLAPSAVEEIIAVRGNADFTVVDAFTGRIVKYAKGEAGKGITNGLEKGIYVLVIDNGSYKETHKFIKK